MKNIKILSLMICLVLCMGIFFGCGKQPDTSDKPVNNNEASDVISKDGHNNISLDVFPMDMIFSSGAGGWRTQITLKEDGTFVGDYYDYEMGLSNLDYDYTTYICEFNGKYEILEQIDDYSYSFSFTEISTEKNEGEEWIEERIRYIYSFPYGINKEHQYILYADKTPVKDLSEEVLVWWPYRYEYKDENIETLMCWGLYDKKEEIAFFQLNN